MLLDAAGIISHAAGIQANPFAKTLEFSHRAGVIGEKSQGVGIPVIALGQRFHLHAFAPFRISWSKVKAVRAWTNEMPDMDSTNNIPA
jgi:hypothetical protein